MAGPGAFAQPHRSGQNFERAAPAIVEPEIRVGAGRHQPLRNGDRVDRVETTVGDVGQSGPCPRTAGLPGRLGVRGEPALDLFQVAACGCREQAVSRDLRIKLQDAPRGRKMPVPAMAQKLVHACRMALSVEREILERGLERDPAIPAIFARKRLLHVAQAWFGRRFRPGRGKPRARLGIAGTERFEPAFGVFPERVETGLERELAHCKPSFHRQTSAYERQEEGFVRTRSGWMGAGSLAADRRRSSSALSTRMRRSGDAVNMIGRDRFGWARLQRRFTYLQNLHPRLEIVARVAVTRSGPAAGTGLLLLPACFMPEHAKRDLYHLGA